jgi:hypothetical protein
MVAVSRKGPEPPPERVEYEAIHALLEAVYVKLQERLPYGSGFPAAWGKAREAACERSGWTVPEFYEEMDARRRARSKA